MNGMQALYRGLTKNIAALDPSDKDPLLRPVKIPRSPEMVADQIESWANSRARWSAVARPVTLAGADTPSPQQGSPQGHEEPIELHLTRTTRVFRFVDDIRILLTRDGESTRIEATSQSRLGKGDLGQNPRNLKELTRMLQAQ